MSDKRKITNVEKGPDGSIAQVTLDTDEKIPIEETVRQVKLGTIENNYVNNNDAAAALEKYRKYKEKAREMDLIDVDVDEK